MERYSKYKDSGVDWIGEIPEGWGVVRNKYLGFIRARLGWKGLKAEENVDDGYPMFSAFNCVEGNLRPTPVNYISQDRYDESPEIMLTKGDILLVKDGAGIGKYAVVRELGKPSTVNGSLAVISPNSIIDSRYLGYFYASIQFQDYIHLLMDGMGVPHLFQRDLKQVFVPVPPLKDQQAIANYLDEKTSAIDAAVADIERSIELLNEYRQSVISEAVTKGLDTNVPMKNSGNQCLGHIPKTWQLTQLKRIASLHNGDRSSEYPSGNDIVSEGVPIVTSESLGNIRIARTFSKYITREKYLKLGGVKLQKGDVVFCLRGSVGKCSFNDFLDDGIIASSLVVVRPRMCDSSWLTYILNAYPITMQSINNAIGATSINLSADGLANVYVPLPSLDVQHEIAAYLDKATSAIDSLIAQKQSLIVRLREYRSSLISECVTGKVKVPGVKE